MKIFLFIATSLILSLSAQAQILTPVKWSYLAKKTSKTEAILMIRATMDHGWHIYSQTVPDGGPIRTSFSFKPAKTFSLVGTMVEPKPITKFEKTFDMSVSYFEKTVTFQQKIKVSAGKILIKGSVEFATCNDVGCLPPETISFSIPVS